MLHDRTRSYFVLQPDCLLFQKIRINLIQAYQNTDALSKKALLTRVRTALRLMYLRASYPQI